MVSEATTSSATSNKKSTSCYNCGQEGHLARDCKNPRVDGEARRRLNAERQSYRRCFNCGKQGHISAECSQPPGNKNCYNCGEAGHIAKECPAKGE